MRMIHKLVCAGAIFGSFFSLNAPAQNASLPYPAYPYTAKAMVVNPDQGKMGVYRSLAELTYQAYLEKDDGQAAVLARILERVWDRGESGLRTSAPETWGKIDKSMDGFIKPLIGASKNERADNSVIASRYEAYLANLATAD